MLHSKRYLQNISKDYSKYTPKNFKLQNVLLVTKLSRYEFEQMRHPNLNKDQLQKYLQKRGTDWDRLVYLHNLHKDFEKNIVKSFQNHGCQVKVSTRIEFRSSLTKEVIHWADAIVPVGGDGTFLLAAGRAGPLFAKNQQKTPIVGFNSDPQRSAGRLMLPKYFSENPSEAVRRIKSGDFEWMHRSRIRTTLLGNNGHMPESTDLYRHTITKMNQVQTKPEHLNEEMQKVYRAKMKRVLPYLALNEVFIGERVSSRVSLLNLVIDNENIVNKTKCSGLCVSTGTGSTSWHTSINRMTKMQVEDLIKILPKEIQKHDAMKCLDPEEISQKYNQNLLFAADDPRLCYSIREQICVGVWPSPKTCLGKRFASNVFVKSNCIDANLVIDGSVCYPFNDGAKVLLEVHPEDALLTIALD